MPNIYILSHNEKEKIWDDFLSSYNYSNALSSRNNMTAEIGEA